MNFDNEGISIVIVIYIAIKEITKVVYLDEYGSISCYKLTIYLN